MAWAVVHTWVGSKPPAHARPVSVHAYSQNMNDPLLRAPSAQVGGGLPIRQSL